MTILKTNLAFGGESHLIQYLAQCALVGKCPYKNIVKSTLKSWAPIHTSDIATAMGSALTGSAHGKYTLDGKETICLKNIISKICEAADKPQDSIRGPIIPPFTYLWDFFYGTGADVNFSRLVDFHD